MDAALFTRVCVSKGQCEMWMLDDEHCYENVWFKNCTHVKNYRRIFSHSMTVISGAPCVFESDMPAVHDLAAQCRLGEEGEVAGFCCDWSNPQHTISLTPVGVCPSMCVCFICGLFRWGFLQKQRGYLQSCPVEIVLVIVEKGNIDMTFWVVPVMCIGFQRDTDFFFFLCLHLSFFF